MKKTSITIILFAAVCFMAICSCGGSSSDPAADGNTPRPVADAGPDQSVLVSDTVLLDGSGSTPVNAGDPLGYSWFFTSVAGGSGLTDASISASDSVNASFTPDVEGLYEVSLIVNDGTASSLSDTVAITATTALNLAPTADAGSDRTVTTGNPVVLDGSGSTDPDVGDTMSYSWSFASVEAGSSLKNSDITGSDTDAPYFTPDIDGIYEISLTVSDGLLQSLPDSVIITAVTSATCGGFLGSTCPAGFFCDTSAVGCNAVDATGVCVERPLSCFVIYAPVCGCNGITYDNDCYRAMAGATKDHDGACP